MKSRKQHLIHGYENIKWGTYGKSGRQTLRYLRLKDLDTDHLEAILRTQSHIRGTEMEVAVRSVLSKRKEIIE